jgi:hypothetical protein
MKVKLGLAAVAAALVAAPQAQAQLTDFGYRCSPGALRSCFAIQLSTTAFGTGTNVVLRVRNLQGSFYADNGGASVLQRIGLTAPNIAGASGLSVAATGGASETGSAAAEWGLFVPGGIGGPIELATRVDNDNEGGVVGCSAYGSLVNYFSTCGTGWIEFSFYTDDAWSSTSAELAWLSWGTASGPHECGTVGVPNVREECPVVPEPVTMVLLGTGLAGLGGAGLVRRRKQNGDVESA